MQIDPVEAHLKEKERHQRKRRGKKNPRPGALKPHRPPRPRHVPTFEDYEDEKEDPCSSE